MNPLRYLRELRNRRIVRRAVRAIDDVDEERVWPPPGEEWLWGVPVRLGEAPDFSKFPDPPDPPPIIPGITAEQIESIGRAGYTKTKTFGLAVSILPVWMKMIEREAAKAREVAEKGPEVRPEEGRRPVEGMIVSTRTEEGYMGGVTVKMLLEVVDEGRGHYRLWGTMPRGLYDRERSAGAGDRVRFVAKVTPKEPGFGFFSRPTKAEFVEEVTA